MSSKCFVKKLFLFLLYCVVFCSWGISRCHSRLFYTMFPLMAIYYAILLLPKAFKIYEYNVEVHSIPRFSYLWRFLYHLLLFEDNLAAGFVSALSIVIILMWKDLRFLITHAEEKLRVIDTELYTNTATRHLRFSNMHLRAFVDDSKMRYHEHYFNTNKIHLVHQSTQSDTTSNGIINYYDYRASNTKKPELNNPNEKRMWETSFYTSIFIKQRNVHMVGPLLYILTCLIGLQLIASGSKFYLYRTANTVLILIDVVCTLKTTRFWNDVIVDFSYSFVACAILAFNTYRVCNSQ